MSCFGARLYIPSKRARARVCVFVRWYTNFDSFCSARPCSILNPSAAYLSISSSMKSLAPRSTMVQDAWVLVPLKKINSPSPTRRSET